MAKRKGDSGKKDAGWQAYFLTAWQGAKGLFDYKQADNALAGALPGARFYGALGIMAVAGLIAYLITVVTNVEAAYLANFMVQTLREAGVGPDAFTGLDNLGTLLLLNFLLTIPFGIGSDIAAAALSFSLLRLTGGKGTLAAHFQLSAVVSLAYSMSLLLALFAPLPCLQIVAAIALLVIQAYILVYVLAKAFVAAHGVSLGHGLMIAAVVMIIRLVAMAAVSNSLSLAMGLPGIGV